jgi:hypothetical protein
MKVGSRPSPAWETTLASTELRRTIAVVRLGAGSGDEVTGRRTDSTAKKVPATAALKPGREGALVDAADTDAEGAFGERKG